MSNTEVVLNIHDIQAIEFDMLLMFDEFCKQHGLTYYLCGGTLLGAVRHQGFIPWDDDIDIFMARPDYDRMVELCVKQPFGPMHEFACTQNDAFLRPFARIYFNPTHVERKYYKPISGSRVWMDILPVDGLPASPLKHRLIFKTRDVLAMLNFTYMWKVGPASRKLLLMQRLISYPFTMLLGGKRWSLIMEWFAKRWDYETSPMAGCNTAGRYGPGEAMDARAYKLPVPVTFEGHTFNTMSCWHEYLSGIYGDYMQLPPEDKRWPHLNRTTMKAEDYEKLCQRHPELKEHRQ